MAQVYCRKCFQLVDDAGTACPGCGAADPGRVRAVASGVPVIATLAAASATGVYAYAVSLGWESWQERFENLPDYHPLHAEALDTAVGIGWAIFSLTWLVCIAWSWRHARPGRP